MTNQINKSFVAPGVPKIVLYGSYGSGKTQTLHHIEHVLAQEPPRALRHLPAAVYVVLEMGSKSDYRDWHLQLMESLSKDKVTEWVELGFSKAQDWDVFLRDTLKDPNLVQAVKNLRGGGDPPITAWKWLTGQKLSAGGLQRLSVTRNLGDVGTGDMVNALAALGRLATASSDEKLIFLMDEAEALINITNGDAVESVHTYLRRLAEPQNASVGFVISTFALTVDSMPDMLYRPDVWSRIAASNYIEIAPFPSVEDVKKFIEELLRELVDQDKAERRILDCSLQSTRETYPFDAEAFELLCEYASQDPVKTLPRNIINVINECAISAWDIDKPVIDTEVVHDVAPIVFS